MKLRYVIEVTTSRIPLELNEDKKLVVAAEPAVELMEALQSADFSFSTRNKLEHRTGVKLVSVEIVK